MSRSTPPRALQPRNQASPDAVDSGWSTAPPAANHDVNSAHTAHTVADEREAEGGTRGEEREDSAAPSTPSGLQRVAPRGRADGTLLGVAPPQSEALGVPKGRSPIVVHAGVAPTGAMPRSLGQAPPAREELPTAPAIEGPVLDVHPEARQVEALPVPVAPPLRRQPPALPPAVGTASAAPAPHVTARSGDDDDDDDDDASVREPPPVLNAPVAPAAVWRRPEATILGLGDAMKIQVRFAGAERPLWAILAPGLGVLVIGVALMAGAGVWRFGRPRAAEKSSSSPVTSANVQAAPVAPAAREQAVDEAELKKKPPESLTADEVLMLATIAAEKDAQAAKRFRENLTRDPFTLKNKPVLAELRRLMADPDTAREALAAAAGLPGPVSADLLYEIWTGTPNRTDVSELARALVYSRDVRAKASEPLAVALDLRTAQTCADNQATLLRALKVGDRRSLPLLMKLKRKQGCGATKKQDCFPCLREGDDLDATITAVKPRRAPNPFGSL